MPAYLTILAVLGISAPGEDAAKKYEALENEVVEKLQLEELWKDPKRKAALRDLLRTVSVLRTPKAIPVLVRHIDYTPYSADDGRLVTFVNKFPAMGALVDIGIPSVQAVLEVLKNSNPEDDEIGRKLEDLNQAKGDGTGSIKSWLALYCLIHTFDRGGYGQDLAKQRIELEIKNDPKGNTKFLKKALESPLITQPVPKPQK